uniref:Thioredoxin domain-containing protein n=1 Tax=Steinernema glaseri TaxID=37863 RepID=A0A1I8AAN2_9BILA
MRISTVLVSFIVSAALASEECPFFSSNETFTAQIIHRQCVPVLNEVSRAFLRVPLDVRNYRIVECAVAAEAQETGPLRVVRNISQLQDALARKDPFGRPFCNVVVFYGEGCPFSVKMAEVVNALPRIFPRLNVMAIDAAATTKFNSRYGVAGTPMVVLYQDANVRARLAAGYIPLEKVVKTISEYTDFVPSIRNFSIVEEDKEGPLVLKMDNRERDAYFLASVIAMAVITGYSISHTTLGEAVIAFCVNRFVRRNAD